MTIFCSTYLTQLNLCLYLADCYHCSKLCVYNYSTLHSSDDNRSRLIHATQVSSFRTHYWYMPVRYCKQASQPTSFSSHFCNAVSSSLMVLANTAAPLSTSSRTMSTLLHDAAQWSGVLHTQHPHGHYHHRARSITMEQIYPGKKAWPAECC